MNNRISELPDVIIQHIQSFLGTKQATRTILVSKSWLRAWSTCPFLDFDFRDTFYSYYNYGDISSDVIDRTLESYVERGTPMFRFHLYIDTIQERWLNLLRQCNVIELDLNANNNWNTSLFREIFLTHSLQVLRVYSLRFQLVLRDTDVIKPLNLKRLELHWLLIDEVTFEYVMCSCPLIEELLLGNCKLLDFSASNHESRCFMLAGRCASLKRLSLDKTEINHEQLQTILSKSPKLEDLNLICIDDLVKPINLSSVSLRRVNIDRSGVHVLIDAPNLRKLKYDTNVLCTIPFPITITSPITKGVVKVTVFYSDPYINESWFDGLREFLSKFAMSKVKFTLCYPYLMRFDFQVLRASALSPGHEVGTLRFNEWSQNLPILYAFFTICHPKIVLLGHLDSQCAYLKELYKDLNYRGDLECCKFDRNKCWRHYIKDAKLYYMVKNEQKRLDMTGLETRSGIGEVITLALEWKSSD